MKLHEKLCKLEPALWIQVKWRDPDSYYVRGVYFVKKSERTEKPFLQEARHKHVRFYTDSSPIYCSETKKNDFWKITFKKADEEAFDIEVEPVDKFPYQIFERDDFWDSS